MTGERSSACHACIYGAEMRGGLESKRVREREREIQLSEINTKTSEHFPAGKFCVEWLTERRVIIIIR